MEGFVFLFAALICPLVIGAVMWVTTRMRWNRSVRDAHRE
jgi:heme/copper-type cytochrome/quinol oxidase subunit 4